jgi:hypothetical protein
MHWGKPTVIFFGDGQTITDDLIDETYEEQGIYGVSFHTGRQWQVCVRAATGTLPAARE